MKTDVKEVVEVADLRVKIDAKVLEDVNLMSKNSGLSVEEIITTALKRFRSSHADYMGIDLNYP
jgi:hypothetical protein